MPESSSDLSSLVFWRLRRIGVHCNDATCSCNGGVAMNAEMLVIAVGCIHTMLLLAPGLFLLVPFESVTVTPADCVEPSSLKI